jgi:signal transduction histidine kinase
MLVAEVERVTRLVDNLLHLARVDSHPAMTSRLVDLDDLVFTEVSRIRPITDVVVDVSAVSAAQVDGQATSLTHLIRNLLDNAVRHATAQVEVTLGVVDRNVVLTVTDDGPGIPLADRERVFERFARLDESRSRVDGGFGLGLAIVRDVARRHGGDVLIEDHAPGARFVVRLPVSAQWSSPDRVSRQVAPAPVER